MLRNKIYYSLKPFVPRSFRTVVRRTLASHLRSRAEAEWPIMPGSERPSADWRGWPGGKKFALVLTHDVEGRVGLEKCEQLADLELEIGFRSSFNFIPEGEYRVPAALREALVQEGFEVGVHDLKHDGQLYRSKRDFTRRAARINGYLNEWGACGFRSGFMLHNLRWLHELEIKYDMSTFDTDPFEPQPEGRHTIFPFLVPAEKRDGDSHATNKVYVELPYTLPQDSTLFLLLRERSANIWLRKLDWLASNGGMVLINTHPDYMRFNASERTSVEYPCQLYRTLLQYILAKYSGDFWPALPKDVAAWMLKSQSGTAPSDNGVEQDIGGNGSRLSIASPVVADTSAKSLVKSAPEDSSSDDSRRAGIRRSIPTIFGKLCGKRGAVLLFSHYPADPRPRRAAEALTREGAIIDLVCLKDSRDELGRENVNGVNVFRVPLKRRRRGRISYTWQYSAFIALSFAYLTIRSLIRRYDFIHVHNMPDILVFSALVPKALGAKIVLDLHDPMPELMQTIFNLPQQSFGVRILKQMEKWSIRFADLVVTVNLACKKIYSSRSCAPEKISVILNSPDDRIFRFKPSPERESDRTDHSKPFLILYHGSLVHRNGFDLAVDALEAVQKTIPQTRLVVCGARTRFFDTVMQSVRERGLEHSIEYLGARDVDQIVEAIDRCNLGIIPNHRNLFTEINTPTRIFEYLARGKPVIAPRAGGIQDYFGDKDLIYFDLGDADDLTEKIEYVFSHPREVAETVKRGQQVYLAHTWSEEKAGLVRSIAALV